MPTSAESAAKPSGEPFVDPRFWMLINPALPVGGYSYSHGIETAVAEGWITDCLSTREWIASLSSRALVRLELPLLLRLVQAIEKNDQEAARHWNDVARATRESTELLLEEEAKGYALTRLYPVYGIEPTVVINAPGFTAAFAQVSCAWQVPLTQALEGYAWVWFEMLVAAAIKLVPLGHSDGQRLLLEFNAQLGELAREAATVVDDEIGAATPGLAVLSSMHESQHGRVFRS